MTFKDSTWIIPLCSTICIVFPHFHRKSYHKTHTHNLSTHLSSSHDFQFHDTCGELNRNVCIKIVKFLNYFLFHFFGKTNAWTWYFWYTFFVCSGNLFILKWRKKEGEEENLSFILLRSIKRMKKTCLCEDLLFVCYCCALLHCILSFLTFCASITRMTYLVFFFLKMIVQ